MDAQNTKKIKTEADPPLELCRYGDWADLPIDIVFCIAEYLDDGIDMWRLFTSIKANWLILRDEMIDQSHNHKRRLRLGVLSRLARITFAPATKLTESKLGRPTINGKYIEEIAAFSALLCGPESSESDIKAYETQMHEILYNECNLKDATRFLLVTFGFRKIMSLMSVSCPTWNTQKHYLDYATLTYIRVAENKVRGGVSNLDWSFLELVLYAQNYEALEVLLSIAWDVNDMGNYYIPLTIRLCHRNAPFYNKYIEYVRARKETAFVPHTHFVLFAFSVQKWIHAGIKELESVAFDFCDIDRYGRDNIEALQSVLLRNYAPLKRDNPKRVRYDTFMETFAQCITSKYISDRGMKLIGFDKKDFK